LNFRLEKYEMMHCLHSEEYSSFKAEQGTIKERYISDYRTLHLRLLEQSQMVEIKNEECLHLKLLYETDMDEVRNLTGILQDSIASLQLKLSQSDEKLRQLLRSELLEVLCLAVAGTRSATRTEVVTAFWNEKQDTRMQLLDWFSELQSSHRNLMHE
jgi:hypothetical protein